MGTWSEESSQTRRSLKDKNSKMWGKNVSTPSREILEDISILEQHSNLTGLRCVCELHKQKPLNSNYVHPQLSFLIDYHFLLRYPTQENCDRGEVWRQRDRTGEPQWISFRHELSEPESKGWWMGPSGLTNDLGRWIVLVRAGERLAQQRGAGLPRSMAWLSENTERYTNQGWSRNTGRLYS